MNGSDSMNILQKKSSNMDVLFNKRDQMKRGTCQWILDPTICPRYSEWDQASNSDFLLITAPPGYGKSVMCSFLQGELPCRGCRRHVDIEKNTCATKKIQSACTSSATISLRCEGPSFRFSGRLYINSPTLLLETFNAKRTA
jgi:hypothetical protein